MNHLTRRAFLGAAGAIAGAETTMNASSSPEYTTAQPRRAACEPLFEAVKTHVDNTPFVDTHEHFWEESARVDSVRTGERSLPAPDFGLLLSHYTDSDLQVSGLSANEYQRLLSRDTPLRDKWAMVAPVYARCRHTGYQLCLRESLRLIFGEDDLREDNYERLSSAIAEHAVPGFYRRLLCDLANIEYAQVNCIQSPVFRETGQPDLLAQDLSLNPLCVPPNVSILGQLLGEPVTTLEAAQQAIDAAFERYGTRAIALKTACAYWRSLDFPQPTAVETAPLFKRYASGDSLKPEEQMAMEGYLFHYCAAKAARYNLPLKLHTGYYAGHNGMPLARVRKNGGDICPLLQAHPDTKFVLFHIAYPYQDEAIALAKHYANAYVDMCWAWIINPAASVRFLKEFIMAAPACKLFTFGGDYLPVELSVGHAAIARRGISQAITELVVEGWLAEGDVPDLVERIMRGNAHECFDYPRTLRSVQH